MMRGLCLLCWAVLLGLAGACPEACDCGEKYGFQIADCAYRDLEAVPPGFPGNVTTLSLSANRLPGLPGGAFAEVPLLQSLWLAHNEIRTVAAGALAVLGQLKSLDLSHNLISDFAWRDLHNLSALQLLKMDSNELTFIPPDAFLSLGALRSLQLNHNRLHTLAEGTFTPLTALSHLQINDNPFDCTCGIVWLKTWALATAVSIPEQDNIACTSPHVLKGTPLSRLPPLPCSAPSVQLTYQPSQDGAELRPGFVLALHCDADGQPAPQLHWHIQTPGGTVEIASPNVGADGRAPPDTPAASRRPRFQAFANGSLLIPDFGKLEEGTYSCLATNELGSAESSVNVALATPGEGGEDALGRRFHGKATEGKVCYTVDNEVQPSGPEDSVVIIYLSRGGSPEAAVLAGGAPGQRPPDLLLLSQSLLLLLLLACF
ncbi:immunoglobulin superfamily containing leucine-rich repeat protein [Choloepus didactylus]|uniref:immunoglobulin superfamily containing leucine-rich repeat protein n=1 Tax=Choloepus didactylus TaxID=27675 RepID=UPI00189DF658|nr:immunoglobulin superfamily containing leucine-rich repeat protein [Choloepus didactylus]XP_037689395.1 immunoglobulin superfamily containing leucine-rich repeat protein [Choloepus didactylus]XP_037689396.1 immunoglobulin superfamily containing leucine-rich repeat protein [Choloepus didactylus]